MERRLPGEASVPPAAESTEEEGGPGASIVDAIPRDELEAVIKTIPGLAEHVADLPRALAAVPADSIPLMLRILPPEVVREIAEFNTRKGA